MLARLRTGTAQAADIAILQRFSGSRPSIAAIRPPCHAATTRSCHVTTGQFINLGPDGTLVTKDVSIRVGDPGEAYVLIPTEVGYALQASSFLIDSLSALQKRPDRFALRYYHDTQHFAPNSSFGYPRLVVPQQLARQSAANMSPATLYLYGVMHTIVLGGTADAEFAELASTIVPEIGETLERLKDM